MEGSLNSADGGTNPRAGSVPILATIISSCRLLVVVWPGPVLYEETGNAPLVAVSGERLDDLCAASLVYMVMVLGGVFLRDGVSRPRASKQGRQGAREQRKTSRKNDPKKDKKDRQSNNERRTREKQGTNKWQRSERNENKESFFNATHGLFSRTPRGQEELRQSRDSYIIGGFQVLKIHQILFATGGGRPPARPAPCRVLLSPASSLQTSACQQKTARRTLGLQMGGAAHPPTLCFLYILPWRRIASITYLLQMCFKTDDTAILPCFIHTSSLKSSYCQQDRAHMDLSEPVMPTYIGFAKGGLPTPTSLFLPRTACLQEHRANKKTCVNPTAVLEVVKFSKPLIKAFGLQLGSGGRSHHCAF